MSSIPKRAAVVARIQPYRTLVGLLEATNGASDILTMDKSAYQATAGRLAVCTRCGKGYKRTKEVSRLERAPGLMLKLSGDG